MIITEKQQSYGKTIMIMSHPNYYKCVHSVKIGKPEVDVYGITGYIQVEVEWTVTDLMEFAKICDEISKSEKARDEIVAFENKLGFGPRC